MDRCTLFIKPYLNVSTDEGACTTHELMRYLGRTRHGNKVDQDLLPRIQNLLISISFTLAMAGYIQWTQLGVGNQGIVTVHSDRRRHPVCMFWTGRKTMTVRASCQSDVCSHIYSKVVIRGRNNFNRPPKRMRLSARYSCGQEEPISQHSFE